MLPCKSKQTDTCLHRKCSGHSVQRLCKYAHMISYIVIPYYIIRFKLKLLAKLIHCTLRSAPHRILQPGQRELQAGANTLAERNGFGLALAIPLHIHSSPALKDVPKQLPEPGGSPNTPTHPLLRQKKRQPHRGRHRRFSHPAGRWPRRALRIGSARRRRPKPRAPPD